MAADGALASSGPAGEYSPSRQPPSSRRSSFFTVLKRIALNRWMVVVMTFFIMACSGATYNFGIYSQEIKLKLGYNQETINTIGFFKDLGANVGIFSGLLYDVTGPWVVLMCGAILNLFGYLMIWLAVTKKIATPTVGQMCFYICIGANSQAFTNTGVIVTSVKNFPNNRGLVIGLLKGYVGLSGAMLTLLYQAVYGNEPSSFILLIGWLPCVVCLMCMLVIRRMPPSGPENAAPEKRIFKIFLIIALVLAGYLMIIIVVQHLHGVHIPRSGIQALATVMVLIVILPLGIVVRDELKKMKREENDEPAGVKTGELKAGDLGTEESRKEEPNRGMLELAAARGAEAADVEPANGEARKRKFSLDWPTLKRWVWDKPPRGSDFNIPQAIFSIDMLTIFISTTCGVGAGLMAIDNLGQIGAALDTQVATFVSLISIWNFLGRVSSGFVSEMALQRFAIPRTFFSALVMGVAAIGHLIIALNLPGALFAGSILIGLTFGAQWALMFTIISELFGLKYYGTLYNVGGVASPLGSYLLSVRVAGSLYDKEAAKDAARNKNLGRIMMRMLLDSPAPASTSSSSSSDLLCHGAHCYRTTFFIMAAVCIAGSLVALILTARTWKFYKRVYLAMKEQQKDLQQIAANAFPPM